MSLQIIKKEQNAFLIETTRELKKHGIIDSEKYTLNSDILSELIDQYIKDLGCFK